MVIQGTLTNWVGLSIAFNTQLMPLCRIFLHPSDLSFKLLRESTLYFGYNPRQCFKASSSLTNLKARKGEVESAIRGAVCDSTDTIIHLLHKSQMDDSGFFYTIFQISPTNTNIDRLYSDCHVGIVSQWALELFLHQYCYVTALDRPEQEEKQIACWLHQQNRALYTGLSSAV
jgi:hypothetical protein